MKKIFLLTIILLSSLSIFASVVPNRMIVHQAGGTYKGFLNERVDSVTFYNIEGEVKAVAEVSDVTLEGMKVKITRTDECSGFKLEVLSETMVNALHDDASIAGYIENYSKSETYYEDFASGDLSGISLEPNTNYYFVTLGYDNLGIACDICKVPFTTPKKPLVGDPQVTMEVVNTDITSFSCKFTPNADVKGYAVLAGEKGSLQAQYEQWGAMMGFKNIGDMVKSWGASRTTEDVVTWNEMDPNKEYDVFILAWDTEDTYADVKIESVSTAALGGTGVAAVDITLGEYKLNDWSGEMLPSQFITFTPNDQSAAMRFSVYKADVYDADPEGIKNELMQDPPMPITNWFHYQTVTTDFQINTNTETVAIAASKNIDGTWGDLAVKRFTTPAEVTGGEAKSMNKLNNNKRIMNRINSSTEMAVPGKMPQMLMSRGKKLTLINK